MYKIHTILDIVVNKFRTNYIPDREISLDEGMLGWRGRFWFVKVQLDIFVTCTFMMANVDL